MLKWIAKVATLWCIW